MWQGVDYCSVNKVRNTACLLWNLIVRAQRFNPQVNVKVDFAWWRPEGRNVVLLKLNFSEDKLCCGLYWLYLDYDASASLVMQFLIQYVIWYWTEGSGFSCADWFLALLEPCLMNQQIEGEFVSDVAESTPCYFWIMAYMKYCNIN